MSVALVVLLVGASIVGSKIRVAASLILVLLGIGIGYLPFVPLVEIDPSIILVVVLPPLLYAAAATSIGKRLGIPERTVLILEGESLVNDATSLVLLKTAVAAISGSFLLSTASGSFLLSITVAVAVGFFIGFVTVWIRSKLTNPVHDTVVTFIVPFVAFIPAEELHGSGVLAVVVTGLYTGHHAIKRFSATARTNERLNWHTIQFLLENGVFLVMGLQLHSLVDQVIDSPLRFEHIGLLAVALVMLLILVRSIFMVPLIVFSRKAAGRYERHRVGYEALAKRMQKNHSDDELDGHIGERLRKIDLRSRRSVADLQHEIAHRLGWRDGVALSWSGMRGVVTLAAAQSIPLNVPYRAQIVLAAFAVALITLLLDGLTLPALIAGLWPSNDGRGGRKAELASLTRDLTDVANDAIDDAASDFADPSKQLEEAVSRARECTQFTSSTSSGLGSNHTAACF